MKKHKKKIILSVVSIAIVLIAIEAYSLYSSNKKITSIDWMENVTPKEARETAHHVLKYPFGNHHDAYLLLIHHGNQESLSILESKAKNFTEEGLCTNAHCHEAISTIKEKLKKRDY